MDEAKLQALKGVIVGVDGSSRDEVAVEAATREAALRGWPLHLVYVEEFLPAPNVLAWTSAEPSAGPVLERAKAVAAGTDSEVPVTASARLGRPENVLEELSRSAGLLVVGTGRQTAAAHFLYGTVSLNVAAHAVCPVLVVGERAATTPHGRVVVGVDGSSSSVIAVRLAAEEARLRHAELVCHNSWLVEVVEGFVVTEPGSQHWLQVERRHRAEQERVVADALGPTRKSLRITFEVVNGPAVPALATASKHADIVVVGNRGRDGFLGKLLGSVTMGLLKRSHCPVLVTRAP